MLITIDTLRADHVGAYGWARARTPALDGLARQGTLFERAYAAAPITLTSHATILTGRYPPGHGARDNGIQVSASVPTLATELHARGFKTAAFVAAFPLDHQFGLSRGFDVYSDHLPRTADGHVADERPASQVVDEAITWLRTPAPNGPGLPASPAPPGPPDQRFFLWVHLFEPHAPYGDPSAHERPVLDRYDDDIATADREIGRLLNALGPAAGTTMIVAAGDHGEAFGEHGEYAHSIFVYDTTLRVPLIVVLPGSPGGARVSDRVTLADVAPTAMKALGASMTDVDGIDLGPALGVPGAHSSLGERELYAESFAPLVEFGWAPLRVVRSGALKYIAAPQPELYDLDKDAAEQTNLAAEQPQTARTFEARVDRYSGTRIPPAAIAVNPQAAERLRALGYSSGRSLQDNASRPDPKDRRELAGRMAQVTSGELSGAALTAALEAIVRDDPRNPQAHLRLGYARLNAGDCPRAETEFHQAIAGGLPSADAHLGLATCFGQRGNLAGAARALDDAQRLEPDNPVIMANVGILQASKGNYKAAIEALSGALSRDPDLHEARFNLALAYARSGRRADAASTASELLKRLSPSAPQRSEVERLLRSIQAP